MSHRRWAQLHPVWRAALTPPHLKLGVSFTEAQRLTLQRYLRNLSKLSLEGLYQRYKLEPLRELPQLQHLHLLINTLDGLDLSPLSTLRRLKSLHISVYGDQIHDYFDPQPLEVLRSLERLELRYIRLKSLSPLAALKQLRSLSLLYTNGMGCLCYEESDLRSLSRLRRLESLSIYTNQALGGLIPRLEHLSSFSQLNHLSLEEHSKAPIYEAVALRYCRRLRSLNLYRTSLSSLVGLWDLPLERLLLPQSVPSEERARYFMTHPGCSDSDW